MTTIELTDAEWREFQAIPDQGYSHRHWMDSKIRGRVKAAKAEPVTIDHALSIYSEASSGLYAGTIDTWPTFMAHQCGIAAVIAHLAAQPVTVNTVEELDALPRETVVLIGDRVWQKLGGVWPYHEWQAPDGGFSRSSEDFADIHSHIFPLTVIHAPRQAVSNG